MTKLKQQKATQRTLLFTDKIVDVDISSPLGVTQRRFDYDRKTYSTGIYLDICLAKPAPWLKVIFLNKTKNTIN